MSVDKVKRFILKKAAVLFCILVVLVLIFCQQRWFILCGLTIGGGFSFLRFISNANLYCRLFCPGVSVQTAVKGTVTMFALHQVMLLAFLLATRYLNLQFFIGSVAGVLLVPSAVMINSATEAVGITANGFE